MFELRWNLVYMDSITQNCEWKQIFSIPILTIGQTNPFEKLKYDKVIAYEYQGEGGLLIERCIEVSFNSKILK